MKIIFAKNLKHCRKRYGVTQTQLASYLDVGQTTVGNWETEFSEPNLHYFARITQYFGVEATVFLVVDIEKGNLITEPMIEEFKRKGNLSGNRIGNLTLQNASFKYINQDDPSLVNDDEKTIGWIMMKEFRNINEKLDLLLDTGDQRRKK
jgi:transcriptional regulator with XRE-family HTH domain